MVITESNIISSAIVVAMVAAIAVIGAFHKPFCRFLRGSRTHADMLATGIWVRGLGTLFAGSSVLLRERGYRDSLAIYLVGWFLVVAGYYLHFSAWESSYFKRDRAFSYGALAVLIIVGIGAFGFYTFYGK